VSEHQYYEFRAVDRLLSQAEQRELRAISTRAQITAAAFVNYYDWGDFKGNPDRLMARYFDLFLYLANWGSRRFSIRLPKRLLDTAAVERFLGSVSCVTVRTVKENLIVDIFRDEIETGEQDGGDGWLDALAPLRADILDGNLRPFYLIWLLAVEDGEAPDGLIEPLSGIGPLTPSLEAFAQFLCIDRDLVEAAAETVPVDSVVEPSHQAVANAIAGLSEREKAGYLVRLYDGDPLLRAELRRRCRAPAPLTADRKVRRNVGELRERARRLGEERQAAEAKRRQAAQRRQQRKEAEAKSRRLDELVQRGETAWKDVEDLIALRNTPAYEKAAALLGDLRDLALRRSTDDEFHHRLVELRKRHRTKPRLVERLTAVGLD
jgi:hypothetical protein